MERLARVPYQGQAGDFRLMSRRVVDAVQSMPERRRFLRGMVAWVGFEQVPIEYRRAGAPRARRLVSTAPPARRGGLTAFSDVPLSLATSPGWSPPASARSAPSRSWSLRSPGRWSSRRPVGVLAVLFLGGVQLISVGIIGRYLARVHEESLRRPLYLLERVVRNEDGTSTS